MLITSLLLQTLVSLPFVGAVVLALGQWSRDFVRGFTLLVNAVIFYVSMLLCSEFDVSLSADGFQFLVAFPLGENGTVVLGIDGIALALILLTAVIMPISLLVAGNSIATKGRAFAINLLVLYGFLLLSFTTLDLFAFYISFEAVLIPMFAIIGMGGSRLERY